MDLTGNKISSKSLRHVYLFNDSLILTKKSASMKKTTEKLCEQYLVEDMKIEKLENYKEVSRFKVEADVPVLNERHVCIFSTEEYAC